MDSKTAHKKIFERYINKIRKEQLETWYGKGTQIKIHNIDASYTKKIVLIETKIVLGELINEDVMDRSVVDYLIKNVSDVLYPDYFTKTLITWDC